MLDQAEKHTHGVTKTAPQSATMDAFMRIMRKEERTIADRINDPNRPTWEQYKKENADKLDLSGNGEQEMKEYRKMLDATREKKLAGIGGDKRKKKKHKKRSRSSSDDSSTDRGSRHKSHKKKKSRYNSEGSVDSKDRNSALDGRSRRSKHSKKNRRDTSPSPVRLSSFLQQSSDDS